MIKSAVIIMGNPKFVKGNDLANKFYIQIMLFLVEELAVPLSGVSFDEGEPFTEPIKADLWIGHSRGVDRLRFADKDTVTVALGSHDGVNHPKDKSLNKGDVPNKWHYVFTDEMKKAIKEACDESIKQNQ